MTHASNLTPAQRAQLASALGLQQDRLMRERDRVQEGESRVEHARQLLQQDDDDAPQRSAEREMDDARSDSVLLELAAVNSALQRLNSEQYGVCAGCGIDVPFERLRAEPWAVRCVDCENALERGVKGRARTGP